jgi:hypothetical protein
MTCLGGLPHHADGGKQSIRHWSPAQINDGRLRIPDSEPTP